MNILDRIKNLADSRNISLAELERRTGLSSGSITKWNKSSPSIDKVKLIADFFNVTTDELIGSEQAKETSYTETDLAKMVDNAMSFDGQPINDHDREVILAFLKGKYGID